MNEFDEIMRSLSDQRRRHILFLLRDERTIHPFTSGEEERDVELHHVHLPVLEDSSLVEWNRDTDTVSVGDNFKHVEPVLDSLESKRDALPDDFLPKEGQTC